MKNRAAWIEKTANFRTAKSDEAFAIFSFLIVLTSVFSLYFLGVTPSIAGLFWTYATGVGCWCRTHFKTKAELKKLEKIVEKLTHLDKVVKGREHRRKRGETVGGFNTAAKNLRDRDAELERFLQAKNFPETRLGGWGDWLFTILTFLICRSCGYWLWFSLRPLLNFFSGFVTAYLFAGLVLCIILWWIRRLRRQNGGSGK